MIYDNELSNEQAFRAYVSGDDDAFSLFQKNFNYFIISKAHHFFGCSEGLGIEFKDLELVGHTALFNAVLSYRGGPVPFASFVTVVIQNAMLNFVTSASRVNNSLINHACSLDDNLYDDQSSLRISDSVGTDLTEDDLGLYSPSCIGYFEDNLPINVNQTELTVIKAKLEGYTYQEILKFTKMPKRKLDTLIAELKVKLKERFE